jgi:hypothetical protein
MVCVLALAVFAPSALFAQGDYFGQNKVQYHKFDFKVMKTDHFDIYFYPEEEEAARSRRGWRSGGTRLSGLLNHELRGRQPLILSPAARTFVRRTRCRGPLAKAPAV